MSISVVGLLGILVVGSSSGWPVSLVRMGISVVGLLSIFVVGYSTGGPALVGISVSVRILVGVRMGISVVKSSNG